jgi:hypothetical protein
MAPVTKQEGKFKAKRAKILQDLKEELGKGFVSDTFEVMGHKYKIATLNEEEEQWADHFVVLVTASAMNSSSRLPRLACAIKEIDGVPVNDLFEAPSPDDSDEELATLGKRIKEDPVRRIYWLRDQMLLFLSEEGFRPYIAKLWESYAKLEARRDEATASIPN